MSPALARDLRIEHARSRTPAAQDSTVYGTARSSPSSFYAHHCAAIASAAVLTDAQAIRNFASSLSFQLSHGVI